MHKQALHFCLKTDELPAPVSIKTGTTHTHVAPALFHQEQTHKPTARHSLNGNCSTLMRQPVK